MPVMAFIGANIFVVTGKLLLAGGPAMKIIFSG